MRKRKGFTLVELLAVIVILAIILIIAVPGVLSIINKTKNSAYDRQLDMIKDSAKNYVTANTVTWTGENPRSTLVTLDMLQSGGYLDKKIVDPRDKKEILCANVLVTKDNKNKITYDVDMTCNDVQPITPRVGSGMIPIVYDGTNWRKADASNKNFTWFNYGNQQWANVAMVNDATRETYKTASIGSEVKMNDINAMLVWIPRFKYKLFNVDGNVSPVGNSNMIADYTIDVELENKATPKSAGTQNGKWLTHPAFTFGGEELDGFWLTKFEVGYHDAQIVDDANQNKIAPQQVISKPNVNSWRYLSLAKMYENARQLKDNNQLGVTAAEDPHLIKNTEWGALVYLSYSKYGKAGNPSYAGLEKQIRINNNNQYITGCGADSQKAAGSTTCNTYETASGQAASTTGNITGIYDTSGGAWEYVSNTMKDSTGTNMIVGATGFDQVNLNKIGFLGKYMNTYNYNDNWENRSGGQLGDATREMGPFNGGTGAWYTAYSHFVWNSSNSAYLERGGYFGSTNYAELAAYSHHAGKENTQAGYRITIL